MVIILVKKAILIALTVFWLLYFSLCSLLFYLSIFLLLEMQFVERIVFPKYIDTMQLHNTLCCCRHGPSPIIAFWFSRCRKFDQVLFLKMLHYSWGARVDETTSVIYYIWQTRTLYMVTFVIVRKNFIKHFVKMFSSILWQQQVA